MKFKKFKVLNLEKYRLGANQLEYNLAGKDCESCWSS